MSNRVGCRTGLFHSAIVPMSEKRSGITAAWLMAELHFARWQAYNCLRHLSRRHVIEPEARGVYRFAA